MIESTLRFLKNFEGRIFLQTFPDDKILKTTKTDLAQTFNVYNEKVHKELVRLNERGAGIYFCVNELKENSMRGNENVESVRAFFLDLDGAPLEPVLEACLLPSLVAKTSPNRFHAYWVFNPRVKADRNVFRDTQKKIAAHFKGDRSINDLCRVMRLPGYYNMKNQKEPFKVTWANVEGLRDMDKLMEKLG